MGVNEAPGFSAVSRFEDGLAAVEGVTQVSYPGRGWLGFATKSRSFA